MSRRLLFLLPFPPDPEGLHGASRMTGQLLERLAARHEVAALFLRAPEEPPIAPALRGRLAHAVEVERPSLQAGLGARRNLRRVAGLAAGRPLWATDWLVPQLGRRLGELVSAWRPDVVQAELLVMGQYLAMLGDARPPTVLVEHDPGAAAAADLASREHGLRRLARVADAAAWRRYGRRAMAAADAVVAFTDHDAELLRQLAPRTRLCADRARHRASARCRRPRRGRPRARAVRRELRAPAQRRRRDPARRGRLPGGPRARARTPTLQIVGDAPPPRVRGLAGEAVEVTGRVPDVRPHLEAAAVVAAPLRIGGGTRVKVLESLAAGKALVATPRAVAGLGLRAGRARGSGRERRRAGRGARRAARGSSAPAPDGRGRA